MNRFLYDKKSVVRFSETDNHGRMKAVSLFDCFQDVGSEHAAMMGIAATDLLTKNYTWILLRYNVDIHRAPFWNETIRLRSWRHPHKNLYELRKFEIYDESDMLIVEALSSWVMMDFSSRRPVRLSRFMGEDLLESTMPVPDDFYKLGRPEPPIFEKTFNVRMQDIDFNNHVNNSVYIGWAIETVPESVFETCRLAHVDVSYVDEITYGNRICSRVQPLNAEKTEFLHGIYGGEDQKELTRLRTVWEKRI